MQKILRFVLVGVLIFLAVVLIIFVTKIFVTQLWGGQPLQNQMMWGKNTSVQNDKYGSRMMREIDPGQGGLDGVSAAPNSKMMASETVADAGENRVTEKVMKNGSLIVRVKNLDETVERVKSIARERGGLVTNSDFSQSSDNVKGGSMTVKVPVAKFEETFQALKQAATLVKHESVSGTDVTDQYIDLAARLKNKKAQEEALQNILNRAAKVSDIIEITNALGTVRGEIESLEGQMRYLDSQTDMATIVVSITEDARVTSDESFRPLQTMIESVKVLIQGVGQFVNNAIRFIIVGIPMFLVYGLIVWCVYLGARKLVRKFWQ